MNSGLYKTALCGLFGNVFDCKRYVHMLNLGRMLEHIPGLPDLILFWMNDVSVIRVSRCGITRGTFYGKHVLTLIWVIMTGGSFKIVSNWAVLTTGIRAEVSMK